MPDAPRPAGFSLEDAVLDIGGDIGALILYTDAEYDEREIEISPLDDPAPDRPRPRPSTPEHEHEHEHPSMATGRTPRSMSGGPAAGLTYAGIYPELQGRRPTGSGPTTRPCPIG